MAIDPHDEFLFPEACGKDLDLLAVHRSVHVLPEPFWLNELRERASLCIEHREAAWLPCGPDQEVVRIDHGGCKVGGWSSK
jgi:hypothetical protein